MALPDTYKQVEYIESSGTQYINTDIKLNQTHTIELKLNINSNLNQWDKFYGGGDDGSMLFAQYEKSSGTAIQNRIKITNKSSNNMYSTNPQTISAGGTHIFIHSNTSFYIDGVSQSTTTATTFTMNTGLNIFAMGNSQSTGREKSSYKLYYMKIYNSNSSLAYDLVPCYRKSDNKPGLYDLVNNIFYTNAGTGEFTYAESAQSGKIQKILLATNLIRPTGSTPSVIEETYTVAAPGTSGGTPLGKSGYKIIKLIAEHEAYTTNTGRGVAGLHFYGGSNQNYYFHNQYFLGASYNYGYPSIDGGPYGASRIMQGGNSTALDGVRANSGVTSSQRSATRLIYTENTLEYHIGQTYGNWTQEGTITFSNAAKTAVQSLFSDPDFFVAANWWNNINPYTFKQVTVTYQSI